MKYDQSIFSLKANAYLTSMVLIVHYMIGFGLFSDPRSTEFEGETLDSQFIFQFLLYLSLVTLMFYLILTRYRRYGLKILYSGVFMIAILVFILEFGSVLSQSNWGLKALFILFFSSLIVILLFATLIIYFRGLNNLSIRNYGLLTICVLTARIISLSLDLETFVVIALLISIYDIWNVFRGPLTKLFGAPKKNSFPDEPNDPISEDVIKAIFAHGTPVIIDKERGIITGIGDFFFYTALVFTGFLYWGLPGIVLTFFFINLGIFCTHLLLKLISPLPGLPIPVLFSLFGFLSIAILST